MSSVTDVPSVLIVDDDASLRGWLSLVLSEAGFRVTLAGSFAAAQHALRTDPPDLLVADVRLDAHNGLQLVATAPAATASIVVTGFPDVVLEAEAIRFGASFVVKPMSAVALVALAQHKIESRRRQLRSGSTRRWDRTRPAHDVAAAIPLVTGRVIDMSYGGIRLELPIDDEYLPGSFVVTVPYVAAPIAVSLVWTHRLDDQRVYAGASISWHDSTVVHDWARFVDARGRPGHEVH